MTAEKIVAAIKEVAEELGHVPSFREVSVRVPIKRDRVRRVFGSYHGALKACGLERVRGRGPVELAKLFVEWAEVVRKLGKIPTIGEYEAHSRHSMRPLFRRFGGWRHVPAGLVAYAEREGLAEEWADVVKLIRKRMNDEAEGTFRQRGPRPEEKAANDEAGDEPQASLKTLKGPMYGPPMMQAALAFGPVNEMGVVYMFGMVAWSLGFVVMRIQAEFPDCEAMRRVNDRLWQKVRIEFEYESRNYLRHMHPLDGCDVIVCWINNWHGCPLEVVELSKLSFWQLVSCLPGMPETVRAEDRAFRPE